VTFRRVRRLTELAETLVDENLVGEEKCDNCHASRVTISTGVGARAN
jgi:hypothetical protein